MKALSILVASGVGLAMAVSTRDPQQGPNSIHSSHNEARLDPLGELRSKTESCLGQEWVTDAHSLFFCSAARDSKEEQRAKEQIQETKWQQQRGKLEASTLPELSSRSHLEQEARRCLDKADEVKDAASLFYCMHERSPWKQQTERLAQCEEQPLEQSQSTRGEKETCSSDNDCLIGLVCDSCPPRTRVCPPLYDPRCYRTAE